MSHIKSVAPKDDYRLDVFLDNGSSITLNMESRLGTIRFVHSAVSLAPSMTVACSVATQMNNN